MAEPSPEGDRMLDSRTHRLPLDPEDDGTSLQKMKKDER